MRMTGACEVREGPEVSLWWQVGFGAPPASRLSANNRHLVGDAATVEWKLGPSAGRVTAGHSGAAEVDLGGFWEDFGEARSAVLYDVPAE